MSSIHILYRKRNSIFCQVSLKKHWICYISKYNHFRFTLIKCSTEIITRSCIANCLINLSVKINIIGNLIVLYLTSYSILFQVRTRKNMMDISCNRKSLTFVPFISRELQFKKTWAAKKTLNAGLLTEEVSKFWGRLTVQKASDSVEASTSAKKFKNPFFYLIFFKIFHYFKNLLFCNWN